MFPIHDDNPIDIHPLFTWALVGCCVAVFLWQVTQSPAMQQVVVYAFGVIPGVLFGKLELASDIAAVPPVATVFSSMFLHGGWMHLIGNMLYLWVFGNNIEWAMGHVRFIVFYLVCGVAAVFAQALPDMHSQIPMIGASGAISGILGAYLMLYPHARVLVVIPIFFFLHTVRVPAMLVLGIWFLMQLVSSLSAPAGEGGVAFGAHIGGFIAGMLLVPVFKRREVPLQLVRLGR